MGRSFGRKDMNFKKFNEQIPSPDRNAISQAKAKLDSSAKPIGSLGLLEEALASIAGVLATSDFSLEKKSLLLLIADNGVLAQGVAQTPAEVTLAMAKVIASGRSAACLMANQAKIDVCPVDMGMFREAERPEILNRRIAAGTRDITLGPAMSRAEALHAIEIGIELAHQKKEEGYQLLLTGEMGIGNTTSATATACALLGLDVACATGRGAGLSDEGLLRKREVISRALKKNAPDPKDALGVLSKLGGFDLAGLCGVFLGGAFYRIPVLIDGFPSSVAALVAQRLCPAAS